MAAQVLDEAGTPYFYSTHGHGQTLDLVHGTRLAGAMQVDDMASVCRDHDIRLIVDAAHPFAHRLHRNVVQLALEMGLPVIRYDRIYPPRDTRLVWCRDYADAICQLNARGINRLLALTGVNTIQQLKTYWMSRECWFRILKRTDSVDKAREAGFPADHLVYYQNDNTQQLLEQLRPEAILTKESGHSGGFDQKVAAAQRAGVPVYTYPSSVYSLKLSKIFIIL